MELLTLRLSILCLFPFMVSSKTSAPHTHTSSPTHVINNIGHLGTATYQLLSDWNQRANPLPALPDYLPPEFIYLRLRNVGAQNFRIHASVHLEDLKLQISLRSEWESEAYLVPCTDDGAPPADRTITVLREDTNEHVLVSLYNHKSWTEFEGKVTEWDISERKLTHRITSLEASGGRRVLYDTTEPEVFWRIRD